MSSVRLTTEQLNDLLASCDAQIRAGEGAKARQNLEKVEPSSISRRKAQKFAHLCYRVGLFQTALRVLAPYVRPKIAINEAATPSEIATYAINVVKIGSVDEGIGLLSPIQNQLPEAKLYLAFAYQARWDYQAAIPQLQAYITDAPSEYERTIAKVNLLAAQIAVRNTNDAEPLAHDIFALAKENRWTLLYKNAQELSAQLAITKGDYDEAHRLLSIALGSRYSDGSLWDFFMRKWRAVANIKAHGALPQHVLALKEIQVEAMTRSHWESTRECDYLLAIATRDHDKFAKVYYGTPHTPYRERILNDANGRLQLPDSYLWQDKGESARVLNRTTGKESNTVALKPGQVLHSALNALSSDFYRPLHFGQLHAQLFPGDYYNPETSLVRVANVIKRLRAWFKEANVPLSVSVNDGFSKLTFEKPYSLLISNSKVPSTENAKVQIQVERLKENFKDGRFTSQDAARALGVSKASAVNVLTDAVKQGRLAREGQNRSTIYRLVA